MSCWGLDKQGGVPLRRGAENPRGECYTRKVPENGARCGPILGYQRDQRASIMPVQITRTKVIVPRRRADLLSRKRLLNLLDDILDYRLTVIAAPAGYGKTSLLVDFAHQAEFAVCWFALDEYDQDIERFLAHFVAAIQQRFPEFGEATLAFMEALAGVVDIPQLVSVVVNDIYDHISEHFAIVLDDYHLVDASALVNEFISRFGQEMDENCHLVIASRSLLSLPNLPLMVGRSQVKGLSFEELAFQPQEIQALFEKRYHRSISVEQAEVLVSQTNGWITGMLLSNTAVAAGINEMAGVARVARVDVYDYLAQQVLDQQPSDLRRFLLRTACLGEFDAHLCAEVLGDPPEGRSWGELIEAVIRSNLFVQLVENDGIWLRYHHLFGDFLAMQYRRESPDEAAELLHRMVDVYTRRGAWEKAYAACQRLEDERVTARFLEKVSSALIASGRSRLLAEWLDRLPPAALEDRPALASRRGAMLIELAKPQQALAVLKQAERQLDVYEDAENLARNLVWQAAANRLSGSAMQARECAERALALAEAHPISPMIHNEASRELGMALVREGRLEEAVALLKKALRGYQQLGDEENVARLHADLGLILMNSGRGKAARSHYQRALGAWTGKHNLARLTHVLNNIGVLAHQQGDYRQAEETLRQAMGYARRSGDVRMQAFIAAGLGDLFADLEAFPVAQHFYDRAAVIAAEMDEQSLRMYIPLARARLLRLQGALSDARQVLLTSAENSHSSQASGQWLLEYGALLLMQGEVRRAIAMLEDARSVFKGGGQMIQLAQCFLRLAWAYFRDENLPFAQTSLRQFLETVQRLETNHPVIVDAFTLGPELDLLLDEAGEGFNWTDFLAQVRQFEQELPALRRELTRRHAPLAPAKTGIRIQVLGAARVRRDGQLLTMPEWANQRVAREMFFYLLTRREGFTKEALGDALWPRSEGSKLTRQLKNTVYRLRRALGKEAIIYDLNTGRYRFNWKLDYRYDVEEFDALLYQAQQTPTREERLALRERAIALYRGDYLSEYSSLWIEPLRARYRQLFIGAGISLGEDYMSSGQTEQAMSCAHRLLDYDACLENAHQLLMRAYARLGDRVGLARQYQQCRDHLARELGVPPSKETEMLYQRLMKGT